MAFRISRVAASRDQGRFQLTGVFFEIDGEKLPLVHVVNNLDKDGRPTAQPHSTGNYFWHTDKSYHDVPSLATLLHALVNARSKSVIHVIEEQSAGIIAEHAEKSGQPLG